MRDLSGSSSKWWDAVLRATTEAYSECGFVRKPLQRLYVVPRNPIEEDPSWGRVETARSIYDVSCLAGNAESGGVGQSGDFHC